MPEELRSLLANAHTYFKAHTILGNPDHVVAQAMAIVGDPRRIWLVGDVVCMNFVSRGYLPKACIVDFRSERRRRIEQERGEKLLTLFPHVIKIKNPPGHLCRSSINAVKDLARRGGGILLIEGEEDLLGLAVLLKAPIDDVLIYGIPPRKGIAIVPIDRENREKAQRLIAMFKEANR
ncbi:MAG: hypothetical protein DRO12_01325 [Thermoprotei archaeon]|nr:MAG: hypothetical protein DRO12_01325 [Thermoprotei archaeon]